MPQCRSSLQHVNLQKAPDVRDLSNSNWLWIQLSYILHRILYNVRNIGIMFFLEGHVGKTSRGAARETEISHLNIAQVRTWDETLVTYFLNTDGFLHSL